MPLVNEPNFSAPKSMFLEIDKPGSGGLNLNDPEYELENNQSPDMVNMMYRNGVFSKRYGTNTYHQFKDSVDSSNMTIRAVSSYKGEVYVMASNANEAGVYTRDGTLISSSPVNFANNLFINFDSKLYLIQANSTRTATRFWQYDGTTFSAVDPYVPTILINRTPDGETYYGDNGDALNMIGGGFQVNFHGDGTSLVYQLPLKNLDNTAPIVKVGGVDKSSTVTFDKTNGTVTFPSGSAPPAGDNNVEIIAYQTDVTTINQVLNCKYWCAFGGNNNSRLFLAGNGQSQYFYSYPFDPTYFPYVSYAQIGSQDDDITGLAEQYNVLFVFKPHEIYSLQYYDNTSNEDLVTSTGGFTSQLVNSKIGCDCPYTIQLIDNRLTWLNSTEGVCTVVSSQIKDERNVLMISRNINGRFNTRGLLNEDNLQNAVSADYDGKYIIAVTNSAGTDWGMYVWDYTLTPYWFNGYADQCAKRLAWFYWNGNGTKATYMHNCDGTLYFATTSYLRQFNTTFNDYNGKIDAYYKTPMFEFGAVEWYKTVKNMWVQCRTDAKTDIGITYLTDRLPDGKADKAIRISGRLLWKNFKWGNGDYIDPSLSPDPDIPSNTYTDWIWEVYSLGETFRRRCYLKKVQMAGVLFWNRAKSSDLCISHLAFEYIPFKNIK